MQYLCLSINLKDFSSLSFLKIFLVLCCHSQRNAPLSLAYMPPPPLHPSSPPSPSPSQICLYHLSVVLNVYSFWNTLEWKVLWSCKVFLSQSSAIMSRSWRATPLLFQCCDGTQPALRGHRTQTSMWDCVCPSWWARCFRASTALDSCGQCVERLVPCSLKHGLWQWEGNV